MDHRRQQVERIARAFYDAQEEALDWDSAPKFLKEEFCQLLATPLHFLSSVESSWRLVMPISGRCGSTA